MILKNIDSLIFETKYSPSQVEKILTQSKPISRKEFDSILKNVKVDTSKWIKDPSDLYTEIKNREQILTPDGVCITAIARCEVIRKDGKVLKEYQQIFKNGKITNRMMSPRGKVMIGESPKIAIQREISEELGLPIEVTENIKFISKSVSYYNSDFFPGLNVIALDYDFELHLDDKYVKDEYVEHQEKKDSYFKWFDK
jgi:hypothetical protein